MQEVSGENNCREKVTLECVCVSVCEHACVSVCVLAVLLACTSRQACWGQVRDVRNSCRHTKDCAFCHPEEGCMPKLVRDVDRLNRPTTLRAYGAAVASASRVCFPLCARWRPGRQSVGLRRQISPFD